MNWLKYRFLYFFISLAILLPGLYSLWRFGLNPSVEFTGGSLLEISLESPSPDQIKDLLSPTYSIHSLDHDSSTITLKLDPLTQSQADQIVSDLKTLDSQAKLISFTSVGPSVGGQLFTKALTAILIAALATLLYIAYSFRNLTFGLFAIIAMLHDTLILLGSYSLLGHFLGFQTDLLIVTAILTTLSFSVHDTIVVFDRIRELKNKNTSSLYALSNQAITETITRSLNNSLTIIFMLLSLALLGGDSIKHFTIALLIGAITGTYSSTFTAVPLLVTWDTIRRK